MVLDYSISREIADNSILCSAVELDDICFGDKCMDL